MLKIQDLRNIEVNRKQFFDCICDALYEPNEDKIEKLLLEFEMNKSKEIFGIFRKNNLIGVIAITTNESIIINYIGVNMDERNNGIGTKLITFIKNRANKSILAETDNEAVHFYEKTGFSSKKIIKKYGTKDIIRFECTFKEIKS